MIGSFSVQEFCENKLNDTGGQKKPTKQVMLDKHIDSLKWAKVGISSLYLVHVYE
jgi:hypothetical protein